MEERGKKQMEERTEKSSGAAGGGGGKKDGKRERKENVQLCLVGPTGMNCLQAT